MPSPPAPVVSAHEVAIANLDRRLDGLRIAHLSDIHVGNLTPARHIRPALAVLAEVAVLTLRAASASA
jgi:hypothetical protein